MKTLYIASFLPDRQDDHEPLTLEEKQKLFAHTMEYPFMRHFFEQPVIPCPLYETIINNIANVSSFCL